MEFSKNETATAQSPDTTVYLLIKVVDIFCNKSIVFVYVLLCNDKWFFGEDIKCIRSSFWSWRITNLILYHIRSYFSSAVGFTSMNESVFCTDIWLILSKHWYSYKFAEITVKIWKKLKFVSNLNQAFNSQNLSVDSRNQRFPNFLVKIKVPFPFTFLVMF